MLLEHIKLLRAWIELRISVLRKDVNGVIYRIFTFLEYQYENTKSVRVLAVWVPAVCVQAGI